MAFLKLKVAPAFEVAEDRSELWHQQWGSKTHSKACSRNLGQASNAWFIILVWMKLNLCSYVQSSSMSSISNLQFEGTLVSMSVKSGMASVVREIGNKARKPQGVERELTRLVVLD